LGHVPPQVFEKKTNDTCGSVDLLRNAMYNSALKLQILIHSTAVVTDRETISIFELA